ncbi:MAG: uroporphyrinogen decarboxylase family protein [bacterium]
MTSRERVIKAIKFEQPDLIPVDYWILPAVYLKYGDRFTALLNEYPKDFPDALDVDAENICPPSHRKGEYTDCFGSVWRQEHDGFLGQVVKYPLEELSAIKKYQFPEPNEREGEISLLQIRNIVSKVKPLNRFVSVDSIRTFERMHFLRGMEDVMMDLAYQRDEFFMLLEKTVEWNIAHMRLVLEDQKDGVDGIWFSDDWGSQSSLLINPVMWRKIFKPVYKKMFDTVKEYGKFVLFHSDGYIMEIIGDLIEIGADVLNCQMKILNAVALSSQFAGKITFHTDLDRQHILPYGTKKDIVDHVKDAIDNLGGLGGGLILNAELGPDMPFENIETLFREFHKVREC